MKMDLREVLPIGGIGKRASRSRKDRVRFGSNSMAENSKAYRPVALHCSSDISAMNELTNE